MRGSTGHRSDGFQVGSLLITRLMAMVLSFAANLYTIHLLAQRGGSTAYALFALIVSLLTAVPFADLGTAASVINATADRAAGHISRVTFVRHVRRVAMLDGGVAVLGITASGVLYLSDSWGVVLGHLAKADGASAATSLVVICLAVMVPLGIGARVLQGLGQALTTVRWQLPAGPIQIAIVLMLRASGAPAAYYALSIALATLVSAFGTAISSYLALRRAAPPEPGSDSGRLDSLLGTAAPYFITLTASSAAYQLDRIVLSHVNTATSVAAYSLIGQFVVPGLSLLVMASQNLWPMFRSLATQGVSVRSAVLRQTATFCAAGGAVAIAAGLASGVLGPVVAAHKFSASAWAIAAGCGYLVAAAAQRPLAMLLNDRQGLWQQAAWGCAAAVVSMTLTIIWGRSFGATGAWTASLVACLTVQALPLWVFAMRRDRITQRRSQAAILDA